MTQGIDLITKTILEQTIHGFRGVRREWLVDGDETALFTYVSDHLVRYGQLPSYNVMVQNGYPLPTNLTEPINYYRTQLSDRYLISVARDQYTRLHNGVRNYDPDIVRSVHQDLSTALSIGNSDLVITDLQTESELAMLRSREALRNTLLGYTTGYDIFDQQSGGHQRGDLDIYVGRPNTGKSYFLLRDAYINWRAGARVMFVSLEMSNVQMATRNLALYSGINPDQFKTGHIATPARRRLDELISGMGEMAPFYFLSGGKRKSIDTIEAAIDRVDPDLIYIDACYLLSSTKGKFMKSRREVISAAIEELKDLAANTNKAFVGSVQFNREADKDLRVRKKDDGKIDDMNLSFIGESDVISQQVSNAFGIHPPKADPLSRRRRILQNIKNREGEVMTKLLVNFMFDPVNLDPIRVIEDAVSTTDTVFEDQARENLQAMNWMI